MLWKQAVTADSTRQHHSYLLSEEFQTGGVHLSLSRRSLDLAADGEAEVLELCHNNITHFFSVQMTVW